MGEYKDPANEDDVRVNLRQIPEEADDEFADEFADDGAAPTTVDPDALKKLRQRESASDAESQSVLSRFEALDESAADEFDDQGMTVMDPRSLSERESSTESAAAGTEACPKCGVLVAPGYPKCPRCQAVLIKGSPVREHGKGGTSVIGRTVPWTIVVIAAILTAVIYYLAERDVKSDLDQAPQGVESPSSEAAAPGSADLPTPDLGDNETGDESEGAGAQEGP